MLKIVIFQCMSKIHFKQMSFDAPYKRGQQKRNRQRKNVNAEKCASS